MSECTDLLHALHAKGVSLWLDDGRLCYRASKGTLTAADIATLRSMKSAIVEVLRQGQTATADTTAVGAGATIRTAPLTLQQECLWQALQSGAVSYRNASAFRICGALNAKLLQRSLQEVVRRHDSLRTRITSLDGVALQRLDPPGLCRLESTDLVHEPPGRIDSAVQTSVGELTCAGFDLSAGPLFESRLLRLGAREHLLISAVHHIVSDGMSQNLVFRELWQGYAALARGNPPPSLQDMPMQYVDYALWQRTVLHTAAHDREVHWRRHLDDATAIRWPMDASPSQVKRESYEKVPIPFGRVLSDALRELAARCGTTLGMAVLAVYVATLARCCDQTDIVIAVSVTGRDRPELEQLTGYCSYPLYMRVRLERDDTFCDLLERIGREFSRALTHADFGSAVMRTPQLRSHAMFQWFPWQSEEATNIAEFEQTGVTVSHVPLDVAIPEGDPFAYYHIIPIFQDTRDGVVGSIFYRPALRAMIEHIAKQMFSGAYEVAAHPASILERR